MNALQLFGLLVLMVSLILAGNFGGIFTMLEGFYVLGLCVLIILSTWGYRRLVARWQRYNQHR